jgi:putative flippase GtrA
MTGILWSFTWNRKWTFSEKEHSWKAFIPFLIVQLSLLLVSASSISFTEQHLPGWNINIIWIVIMVFMTFANFLLTKHLVFKTYI